jgi:hypothetical protein
MEGPFLNKPSIFIKNTYLFFIFHSSKACVLLPSFEAEKVAVNHRDDPAVIVASNPTSTVPKQGFLIKTYFDQNWVFCITKEIGK